MSSPPRHCGPLTEHCSGDRDPSLETYTRSGGYEGARRAWSELSPRQLVELVEVSGLQVRGRWSTRVADDWRRMSEVAGATRHVVCQAGISGVGVAQDRLLVERAPHLVLDGLLVAARAVGAQRVHLCLGAQHAKGDRAVRAAVSEASSAGHLGDDAFGSGTSVEIVVGQPAIRAACGEGTAILEALEGRAAHPRPRPPATTLRGLDGLPTWVVDAETCAQLALVAARGADWFRTEGDGDNPGTLIMQLKGHIERPGLYELPLGTRLGELVFEHAGGVAGGRKVGAVLPGGFATAALSPGQLDVPMLAAELFARGSALERAEVVVVDDRTCMVAAAVAIAARFQAYACGYTVHCREGAAWVHTLLNRIGEGRASLADLDRLLELCDEMSSDDHCSFGNGAAVSVRSLVDLFRDDFEAHVQGSGCGRVLDGVLE